MKKIHFFPKFCEPPNPRIAAIKSSWDRAEFVLNRLSLSADVPPSLRIVVVVDVAVSPPLPIRRTVRYSVTVFPNGFGASIGGGGDGWCETGEARVINSLRSLSTVT